MLEQTNAHQAKPKTVGAADMATPGKATQADKHAPHAKEATAAASVDGVNIATLQAFIAKHEGYVAHVYLDSRGFPSAGIGHLLPDGGAGYQIGEPISAAQITAWFTQDTATAIANARKDMGGTFDKLDEARKMVIIDMCFNLGGAGFGEFHQTIAAIAAGNFSAAATDMLQSQWASQVGGRATEDSAIMRSGQMTGGGGSEITGGGPTKAPTIEQVRDGKGVLQKGETGPAVADIQKLLHISADGNFGPQTLAAVESFQRAHKLTVDGVVGEKTLAALDPKTPWKKPAKPKPTDPKDPTGGTPAKGAFTAAPSIQEVKTGGAEIKEGEEGPAVKDVQRLLALEVDGEFGPQTRAAVVAFESQNHETANGMVDGKTYAAMEKHPAGSIKNESHDGAAQRAKMLSIARAGSAGLKPDGRCYYHVCQFLIQCHGYGTITDPYTQFPSGDLPEAHDFANLMNSDGPAKFGLEKLGISNPYDAPAGSIVVVAAGSPGTANPTAGDISIADGNGNFYNGGMMSYGGSEGWSASPGANLLGCYVPR
jgi:peptidoglycan hydrolase-like protein with peptidoglycan-binding domain/GH24 family phage-related lysozyme (muramidase)